MESNTVSLDNETEERFVAEVEGNLRQAGFGAHIGVRRGPSFIIGGTDDQAADEVERALKASGMDRKPLDDTHGQVGVRRVGPVVQTAADGEPIATMPIIHAGVHINDPHSEFAVRLEDVMTPEARAEAASVTVIEAAHRAPGVQMPDSPAPVKRRPVKVETVDLKPSL